ncbi:MAG TPA: MFS transporter [Candidatus Baltobacteraceae bacterium]|nr:MFS transporter [Candidatus Baltobacteraceae bacterium]
MILAPLRFRDFRLMWFGLMISNLGTWMQFTAMGFFVSQLAGTPHRAALYLGIIGGARAIPVLLLSPVAGVVADSLPRRRVLLATNLTMSLAALALAILSTYHRLDLLWLIVISAANAAANAFDSPVRQSWVPLLVDRPYVGNAIGLQSIAFNAPAVVGPAIAGLLIVWVGVAGSFYINAIATLAVVVAVVMMKPSPPSIARREPMLESIRFGLRFLRDHRILRWIMLVFFITAVTTRPYSQLIPAFVVNTLHGDARALGWAVAAVGIGGFGGGLVTAIFAGNERRSTQWLIAGVVMSSGVFALSFVWSIALSLPILFMTGLGTLAFLGASNTMIQTLSPDEVRGRAISVYTMIALGVVPGGSLVVGSVAALIGLHLAFAIAGGLCLAVVVGTYVLHPVIRTV